MARAVWLDNRAADKARRELTLHHANGERQAAAAVGGQRQRLGINGVMHHSSLVQEERATAAPAWMHALQRFFPAAGCARVFPPAPGQC